MLITKTVKLKVNGKMINFYKNLGYIICCNKETEIKISDLHRGSHIKIECQCDICEKISHISYRDYLENIKSYGYYTCSSKCSMSKNRKTNKEKYGVEYGFQDDKIKEKSKKTKLLKYDDENYKNLEKRKITCLEKYGFESPSKSENVKEKTIKTNNERYGVDYNTQTDEYKIRTKETNLKKYGVEWHMSSKNFKEKSKITNLERYGVENSSQNKDIFHKQQISSFKMKKYKESNLTYQGTYELDFLDKFYNKINIENGMTIRYNDNKVYFPDFFIPELNMIIEIKSGYTYKLDESKNLEKQKSCLKQGYYFIFIIDKNYEEFEKLF